MDQQAILAMMMAAAAQGNQFNPAASPGNPFYFQGSHTVMPQQDTFFGPLGALLAPALGLATTGAGGAPVPILHTNIRPPTNQTGFASLTQQQNLQAYGAAQAAVSAGQAAAYQQFLGPNNVIRSIAKDYYDEDAEGLRRFNEKFDAVFKDNAVAKMFGGPMLNQFVGYADRGAGASVTNMLSPQMLASFAARYGVDGKGPGEAFDPFGQGATDLRSQLAGEAYRLQDSLLYDGLW